MPRHYDKKLLTAASEALRSMPEPAPISARQAVLELAPDIRAAMDQGHRLEDIAKRLRKYIPISFITFRSYYYGNHPERQERPAQTVRRTRKRRSA